MLEELKEILGNLYSSCGLNNDILRLSQLIDILVYQEMQRGVLNAK